MPEMSRAIASMPRSPDRSKLAALPYRIREVDGQDEEITEILTELHRLTFFDGAPIPAFDWGHWWLAYCERTAIAFAGVVPSTHVRRAGYIHRVGVLAEHRGRGLQLRLMRAMEVRAGRQAWSCVVSDTPATLPRPTTLSGPAIGCTSPDIPGPFRTHFTGTNPSAPDHPLMAPTRKGCNPVIPPALPF
jgi:GNAT superfamily N-acetyltransferase